MLQSMGHKELDTTGWLNNNNVHCSIIYNWQDMETTQVPINRGMDEEDMCIHIYTYIHTVEHYTHTHIYIHTMGTLLSHEKKWNLAICNSMNGPRGHYTKWNKLRQRKINTVWFHLHVELKKQNKWTNATKHKQSHNREKKWVFARGEAVGVGDK